jgi:hypothetical protein
MVARRHADSLHATNCHYEGLPVISNTPHLSFNHQLGSKVDGAMQTGWKFQLPTWPQGQMDGDRHLDVAEHDA